MNSKTKQGRNVKIIRGSMEPYYDGWKWQIECTNEDSEKFGTVTTYRTNREGDGLWRCGSYEGQWAHNYEDKQVLGTLQFSLPEDYDKARRKIRSVMSNWWS